MYSSSGSSTVTTTTNAGHRSQPNASIASLPSAKRSSPEISKAYKHASQLFLTRSFAEALRILEPIVASLPRLSRRGDEFDDPGSEAPIATATKSQRIKVWVLYITLLSSIIDLGQDEGKRRFGEAGYNEIVRQVHTGEIWDIVVRDGYGGREGSVDTEVVNNLHVCSTNATWRTY
jgi:hypothetical protein